VICPVQRAENCAVSLKIGQSFACPTAAQRFATPSFSSQNRCAGNAAGWVGVKTVGQIIAAVYMHRRFRGVRRIQRAGKPIGLGVQLFAIKTH